MERRPLGHGRRALPLAAPDALLHTACCSPSPACTRRPARAQATDVAVIPAPVKAQLRDELVALSRKVADAARDAAKANKQLAVTSAVATADAAAEAGSASLVARLEVGSDLKALNEAWYAISAKHPGLAAMLISVDAEKEKVRRGAGGWGWGLGAGGWGWGLGAGGWGWGLTVVVSVVVCVVVLLLLLPLHLLRLLLRAALVVVPVPPCHPPDHHHHHPCAQVVAFAGVPDALVPKLKAGDWVGEVLKVLGGKGGGRPNAAQGQGSELGKVDEALALAAEMAKLKL